MARPRNPKNWCFNCGTRHHSKKHQLCNKCGQLKAAIDFGSIKKSDCEAQNARHRYQSIRHHGHRLFKAAGIEKRCAVCHYSYYVELCHIRSIECFPEDASFNTINSFDNLAYLCPNHHKELDLGALQPNDIESHKFTIPENIKNAPKM